MFAAIIRTGLTLSVATLATAGIVAFSAAPASAATATVHTAGIDLNSTAGRAAAEFAIRSAAGRVCRSGDGRNLAEARAVRTCVATAIAAATPQLDRLAAARNATRAATQLAAVTAVRTSAQ